MSRIGDNIKLYRKKAHLTQAELALKCGLATGTIQQYELGKREPKIEIIDKIASVLGIRVIDLMEHYTLQQYKKTNEYWENMKFPEEFEWTISILKELYGAVEHRWACGSYGSSIDYYLCGEGKNKFVLYEHDLAVLHDTIKSFLPSLVNYMGDTRPESEIIDCLKQAMDDMNSHKRQE